MSLADERNPTALISETRAIWRYNCLRPHHRWMRIAVVTSYFPNSAQPYRGHSAYHTVRNMTDVAEIRVFCPLTRYPAWLRPTHFPYLRADLSHTVPGVPTEYFEYPAVPVASRPFNPYTCEHFLAKRVETFSPDVILNYFVYPEGCAAISVGKTLGKPVLIGVIGSDVNRIPDRATEWHTRKALRHASSVITVSQQLTNRAVELGAHRTRTRTIPNGCDTALFCPRDSGEAREQLGLPQDAQLILFVGWLAPTKGVRELLEAAELLALTRPAVNIAFVGEGELASEIQGRGVSGRLKGKVLAPGALPSSQVALWMASADVLCLPSYAEGCPNVVLEALACGRPVVASNVGSIPELVDEQSGLLVPPRHSQALARALDQALSTRWNPVQIAARFDRSWQAVANETFAVCSEVVTRGAHDVADTNIA